MKIYNYIFIKKTAAWLISPYGSLSSARFNYSYPCIITCSTCCYHSTDSPILLNTGWPMRPRRQMAIPLRP